MILDVAAAILVVLLGALAVAVRGIDIPGAISGSVIAYLAFLAGGFSWLFMIVVFFVLSTGMTRYKYNYKRKLGFAQEKSGVRSWPNSIANGGIAAASSVVRIFAPHAAVLNVMFLSSVACAMSDTIATEIGLLSPSPPRLITRLNKIAKTGTSGAISNLGTLAALCSAIGMALLGVAAGVIPVVSVLSFSYVVFAIVIGAILGTLIDSLIGATIQASYICTVCSSLTENIVHHGKQTKLVKGYDAIDNNVVNIIGIFAGSLISVLAYLLLVVRAF